jgi:AraC family transcriptional regulator, positive regulator of tynA and feaB
MSRIETVSIDRHDCRGSAPEWTGALTTCIGRMPLATLDQKLTSCVPDGENKFIGRIEWGALGDLVLARVGTGTPHRLDFSLRSWPDAAAAPLVLLFQTSGSCRLRQHGRSCTLFPGEWCLIDTYDPFQISSFDAHNENLSLRLDRPSDPELLKLLPGNVARRLHGTTGASRVLRSTLSETFDQMICLSRFSETGLQGAIGRMVWTSLQEQLDEPARLLRHQDVQRARIKSFIEARLSDPDLCVESIAHGCGISMRSVHRAFAPDPAGSVSNYIWMRRITRCAADLRVVAQTHRPITDICFAWGFNSTSHFSRVFKEQFGVSPREYREASQQNVAASHRMACAA